MNNIKQLSEDEFNDKFKLIKNHLIEDASFEGHLFETYGEELQYVFELSKKENRVWTILDTMEDRKGSSNMVLASGFHRVNRLGFLITEEEYKEEYEVVLD